MNEFKNIHSFISIPYGAIKSNTVYSAFSIIKSFQFLMVRLKVQVLKAALNNAFEFQFLMVRLKGYSPKYVRVPFFLFQFLMVRLKGN